MLTCEKKYKNGQEKLSQIGMAECAHEPYASPPMARNLAQHTSIDDNVMSECQKARH